jgi:hypothetical protein
MPISRDRAERIARAHACVSCGEYNYRKLAVREPAPSHRAEFGEEWHALLVCGVCGTQQELGIDGEGDVVYVN